jgi:hypothetical protein
VVEGALLVMMLVLKGGLTGVIAAELTMGWQRL